MPFDTWPSSMPGSRGRSTPEKYIGRSITKGPLAVALTETPRDTGSDTPRPTPAGSAVSKTCTVRRPLAGTTNAFCGPADPSNWYDSVTWMSDVPGLPRVRNSNQPGSTVPSAKFHAVAGWAPDSAWAPLIGPDPATEPTRKYSARSARKGEAAGKKAEA